MVSRITDAGLDTGRPRLFGGGVIPFDEIESVSFSENGKGPRLLVKRAGGKPLEIGGNRNEVAAIHRELSAILDPPAARPGAALTFAEIGRTVSELSNMRGARPSSILSFLIGQAMAHRATDLHFDQAGSEYKATLRIDGILHGAATIGEAMTRRLIAHIKNAAGLASYRRHEPQEGRLTWDGGGKPVTIRLSTAPAHGEESVALRLFDALRGELDLADLGFSPAALDGFIKLLDSPRGLVFVSGPASSGKTTTIYSALKRLMNGPRRGERAVSLEDPIEFPLDCVSQIEVAPHRGLTFDKLLSNALRQDAEVIVIGEVRDSATAAIALRAALTGHLIVSTVHCGAATEVPRRLIDLGLEPAAVAEALRGALAQQLLRRVHPACKGSGCPECFGTGYRGRTAAAETLTVSETVSTLIRENAPASRILAAAREDGMRELREDAMDKLEQGITSAEEIRRVLR